MIGVLVAEDSATVREYLGLLLQEDGGLELVGAARDGVEAVELAERLKPGVIVMDVHMPRMNGYEATRRIMERTPTPIVIVSATLEGDEVAMTFAALEAGALTLVAKPVGPGGPREAETVRKFLETVRLMAEVKVVRRWARREPRPTRPEVATPERRIRIIAMGASTGGPPAVAEILKGLPRDLGASILLVQHIAPGFTPGLVQWLGQASPLPVKVGEADDFVQPATVYVAPQGRQMGVSSRGKILLTRDEAEDGFCPSASFLFESVAAAYAHSAMGILLTGMGRDGAQGLQRLRQAGGMTIAQDEASSAVFGMPGEAIRLGAAEQILSPVQISEAIQAVAVRLGT